MSDIKRESRLSFFEAAGIIVGHGVGAGMLTVPALAAASKPMESMYVDPAGYGEKPDRMIEQYFC